MAHRTNTWLLLDSRKGLSPGGALTHTTPVPASPHTTNPPHTHQIMHPHTHPRTPKPDQHDKCFVREFSGMPQRVLPGRKHVGAVYFRIFSSVKLMSSISKLFQSQPLCQKLPETLPPTQNTLQWLILSKRNCSCRGLLVIRCLISSLVACFV